MTPQLEALVEEGLRNNLDLQAAAYRIDAAAGLVVQARSLLYPQLSLIGGVGAVGRSDQEVFEKYGVVGEMSWELRSLGACAGTGRVGDCVAAGRRSRFAVRAAIAGGDDSQGLVSGDHHRATSSDR